MPRGVYVAMRRQDIRPQAFVACFDADTGRLRWRRFICGAETPARGVFHESTHNLLTLSGGTLYYNTNLGAVAAVATDDGQPLWVSLYPRDRRGDLAKLAPHWRRELNPCCWIAARCWSPRPIARGFSPSTPPPARCSGKPAARWTTPSICWALSSDWLIAGGGRLYWISLKEEDRGRVKHVWPDGPTAGLRPRPAGRPRRVLADARQALRLRSAYRPAA